MTAIPNNFVARAVYQSLEGKSGLALKSAAANVVRFLARRKLMSKTPAIIRELENLADEERGRVRARVSTPHFLEAKTKEELVHFLKRRYSAKEVFLEEKLNENLLGGFQIEAKDEVLDLSLRNKMNQLQKHLTGAR